MSKWHEQCNSPWVILVGKGNHHEWASWPDVQIVGLHCKLKHKWIIVKLTWDSICIQDEDHSLLDRVLQYLFLEVLFFVFSENVVYGTVLCPYTMCSNTSNGITILSIIVTRWCSCKFIIFIVINCIYWNKTIFDLMAEHYNFPQTLISCSFF